MDGRPSVALDVGHKGDRRTVTMLGTFVKTETTGRFTTVAPVATPSHA